MLRLSAEQYEWVLGQQRQRLAQVLNRVLRTQWPLLAKQLGDRSEAFVDAALQQAWRHGLVEPTHAARYVNLWCVWGPAFDDKAGFEWAAEVLRDERRTPAVKVQQLVMHSRDVLGQRAAPGLGPDAFDAADTALELAVARPEALPWIEGSQGATAQPRRVCDMSAFDVALGDQAWRQEYRLAWAGQQALINLAPVVSTPQRFRTDTPPLPGTPATPRQMAALAQLPARGHKAWLHLRCAADTVCDEAVHPRIDVKSDAGAQTFLGKAARLVKIPLHSAAEFVPPKPPSGGASANKAGLSLGKPGSPVNTLLAEGALCRERAPQHLHISAQTCGLRRAGAPLGTQEVLLSVYPADQWLFEIKAPPQTTWHWPSQAPPDMPPPAMVRLERDGQALPVAPWQQAWATLAAAYAHGLEGWYQALCRDNVIVQPRLEVLPQLMQGTAVLTWGAREAVGPEGSSGFLRAQALVQWLACGTELSLGGDITLAGGQARLTIVSKGRTQLHQDFLRDALDEDLAALLAGIKATWRHPFEVEVEALASPELAAITQSPGSQAGAVVGEAGLRPRPDGQGWQWFVQVRLEPATVSLTITDPVRGQQHTQLALWPATTLLDWSAG